MLYFYTQYDVVIIILQALKSKYRARIIEQWVMTARECFNLGNFNSLMAIISALNMSPITRLKKTVIYFNYLTAKIP